MGRAERDEDGIYAGYTPCAWCDTSIDQTGRRRRRRYCRTGHRWRHYGARVGVLIGGILG
ncbi:hypothetical protein [Streptomyces sp. SGAir0957]